MKHFLALTLLAGTAMVCCPQGTKAADLGDALSKERFQIRMRVIDVAPDESSSVNIGGKIYADDAVVPELDLAISSRRMLRWS